MHKMSSGRLLIIEEMNQLLRLCNATECSGDECLRLNVKPLTEKGKDRGRIYHVTEVTMMWWECYGKGEFEIHRFVRYSEGILGEPEED